jgi:hypothetical protein
MIVVTYVIVIWFLCYVYGFVCLIMVVWILVWVVVNEIGGFVVIANIDDGDDLW